MTVTPQTVRLVNIIGCNILAVLAASVAFLGISIPVPVLPVIVGVGFVLCGPGYLLSIALLPRYDVDVALRVVLSIVLSCAVLIIAGQALHWTQQPLNVRSMSLVALTLIVVLDGYLYKQGLVEQVDISEVHLRFNVMPLLLFIAIAGAVVFAFRLTVASVEEQQSEFTQLWLYPTGQATELAEVELGLQNLEDKTVQYDLALVEGEKSQPIRQWQNITLNPGQVWAIKVQLDPTILAGERLEAYLYLSEFPREVYRYVSIELGP